MFVLRWHFIVYLIVLMNLISARIFDRCDLARTLRYKHNLPLSDVNIWVCIAQYQSGYNTEAVGFDGDGIGYHGIFQLSDRYWCSSKNDHGNACKVSCLNFLDDDLTDDFQCIQNVFDDHQRISGNGFNAWTSYKNTCQYAYEGLFTNDCFVGDVDYLTTTTTKPKPTTMTTTRTTVINYQARTSASSRIYHRCELARELWYVHQIPADQIATLVCIAKYVSNFNTSAVGNLNTYGSRDHGLFQISDLYWCSPPGWICGSSCAKLEDSDITDDIECVRKIYDEHNRLSGDGFNAWSVYRPYCKDQSEQYVKGCFDSSDSNSVVPFTNDYKLKSSLSSVVSKTHSVKIYERCELAKELYEKHKIPIEQVAIYVCIAHHKSKYNTSAVSQLNGDGSSDHGIFQISDLYWCSQPGSVCGLSCAKLEDSDITDDVECVKKIYDEHQRLSGDGFSAWSVYNPYCRGQSDHFIDECFDETSDSGAALHHKPVVTASTLLVHQKSKVSKDQLKRGKIFQRCELANQLRFKHNIPIDQISTWMCIAKHESNYNTSAVVHSTDGSGYHGLFKISDIYWCSPPGWVCGLSCSKLEDSDITDDVECIKKIYDEHQRLSGDGFNAWGSYKEHCHESVVNFAEGCFQDAFDRNVVSSVETQPEFNEENYKFDSIEAKGKVYERCELARELKNIHNISIDEISNWVCIAYHESSFNTAAVGHLNADGSADHGIFQISDIYWCSLTGQGKSCGLSCSDLENSNITDDIKCIRKIFDEHTNISGDGFTAWSVYQPYCKGRSSRFTTGCFDDDENSINKFSRRPGITSPTVKPKKRLASKTNIDRGKVYGECELALELRDKYKIPDWQIATWVCIALHESNLNTSAVGHANGDSSGDHGLFQISDIYWCSPQGWACGLSCSDLEDSDISDDIECTKIIYDEHQRLSGDGFNAWSVYPKCKGKSDEYIKGCFDVSTNIETSTVKSVQVTQTFKTTIGEVPSTTPINLRKYTSTTILTSTPSATTSKPSATRFSQRKDFTVFSGLANSDTKKINSIITVEATLPTTLQYNAVTPITSQQSSTVSTTLSNLSVTNSPTTLTRSQSERARVKSLFDIYLNGFQTPRPTTQKYLPFTVRPPVNNLVENTPNAISSFQSYGKAITGSELSLQQSQQRETFSTLNNNTIRSNVLSATNYSSGIQTTKKRSGFRFGINVPTEFPPNTVRNPSTLSFNNNPIESKTSSSDATTKNPFIWHYTTYQSSYSQRPSTTTSYSFPVYNINSLTSTTTKSPSINKHDKSVTIFNNRFTRAPSSTPIILSSNRPKDDQRITTKSPFDKIFDMFVH